MVTPERFINHTFNRLEAIAEKCTEKGSMDKLAELVIDLKLMVKNKNAKPERLIRRCIQILEAREPKRKYYD